MAMGVFLGVSEFFGIVRACEALWTWTWVSSLQIVPTLKHNLKQCVSPLTLKNESSERAGSQAVGTQGYLRLH